MRRLWIALAFAWLLTGSARASLILGTDHPPGSPLVTAPGTTSGLMSITVASNTGTDVMIAWQFSLTIVPDAGATGTVSFNNPPSGIASEPPNYVFPSGGSGISVINTSSQLDANDFDSSLSGSVVPTTPRNLLQVNFTASANASGIFGVFARQDFINTAWTDGAFTTQFFSNVPNSPGGLTRIGEVQVTAAAVPEPSTWLSGIAIVTVALASRIAPRLKRRFGRGCPRIIA